jgi:cell division protease FtsH
MIAYHLDLDPVQQISIIPSGRALGYTLNPPVEDKYSEYKSILIKEISMLLGGRAAEEIIYGDVTGGASNDIERATKTAKRMVMRLGMSETLGPRTFGNDQGEVFLGRDFSASQDYSENIAAKIDDEIHSIISSAYSKSKDILNGDIQKLHFIAEFLVKNEIMDGEQFKAVMESDFPVMQEIEAIAEAKRQKSLADNKTKAAEVETKNDLPADELVVPDLEIQESNAQETAAEVEVVSDNSDDNQTGEDK